MLKIGLEIHQRLDTHKLFCNCASDIMEDAVPDLRLERLQHTVFSELGEVDTASKKEYEKKMLFEYQAFRYNNCLVELDEEPPHPLNIEALKIVLAVAGHLNSRPVDEIHIMRKIIIDGSNTSGFQRTAVVSLGGVLETSKGGVGIQAIAIEEESAGIIEKAGGKSIFRLDRQGIPLIEIATAPDITDGEHLRETAEKLGMVLRSTGKVMRGLGTIRQDVNISIEGGARVELKGAQDLKLLPVLLEYEVKRQEGLIGIRKRVLQVFGGKGPDFEGKAEDLTSMFMSTDSKLISSGIQKGHSVLGVKLENYAGIPGTELQAGRRYGTELSDYAKTAGVKGIIHSDEDPSKYSISAQEWKAVYGKLGASQKDAFVMVVAPKNTAEKALEYVLERAMALEVPEETRRVNPDGTSAYMRPLPGKARMYPETDIPPVKITKELVGSALEEMGEGPEQKREKLSRLLNKEMLEIMLKSRNLPLFEKLLATGADPMLVASTLENTLVALRREGLGLKDPEKALAELFSSYRKGTFVKSAIPEILSGMAKGRALGAVLKENGLYRISGKELERIAKENDYDIKKIMQKYRLRVDPADIAKLKKVK